MEAFSTEFGEKSGASKKKPRRGFFGLRKGSKAKKAKTPSAVAYGGGSESTFGSSLVKLMIVIIVAVIIMSVILGAV